MAVCFLSNAGGDQGLLNSYFHDWATKDMNRRLPFTYNMTATSVYSYRPAYQQYVFRIYPLKGSIFVKVGADAQSVIRCFFQEFIFVVFFSHE